MDSPGDDYMSIYSWGLDGDRTSEAIATRIIIGKLPSGKW
ncbi:hypothetical protein SPLC1_S207290 [Arthrospira platensis C1]|nr:hypothetical protein SPLC1_S207290 [Arthrospira platensis C1]